MKASSVSLDTIFSLVEEHVVHEGSHQTSDLEKPDLELRLHVRNAEVIAIIRRLLMTFLKMCVVAVTSCISEKMLQWSG